MSNWLASPWKSRAWVGTPWLSAAWGFGGAVDSLVFEALTFDPATYEMLGVKTGVEDVDIARASERYALNNEDLSYSVPVYEAAWNGGRNVHNETAYSEDLTNAAWAKTNGTATASVFTATGANATCLQTLTKAASDRIYACTIGRVTGTGTVEITTDGGTTWVDITASVAAATKRFTCNKAAVTDPEYGIRLVTSGDEVSFTYHQNEDATGRADTATPSEYCPADTVGAGDPSGFKIFANENGNSVASNVVTEAAGAALAEVPWLSSCPAATNSLEYSRDLTDASWTHIDVGTALYDEEGLEGRPGTASTVADSGGVVRGKQVATTVADDNATDTAAFYVKKDTDTTRFPELQLKFSGGGSAPLNKVQLNTQTGEITSRDSVGVTAEECTTVGTWWKVLLQVQNNSSGSTDLIAAILPAVTNVFGTVVPTTSGSIIIGNVELSLTKTIAEVRGLPPIFTEGTVVSTQADAATASLDNHDNTRGAYFFEWRPSYSTAEISGDHEILSPAAAAGLSYYDGTNGDAESHDGTNTVAESLTIAADTIYKIGIAYGDSELGVCVDGSWTEGAYDDAFALGSVLSFFRGSTYPNEMRGLQRYDLAYAAAKAKIDELMA